MSDTYLPIHEGGCSRGHVRHRLTGAPIWTGEIHIHVGGLDEPERFAPGADAFVDQKLSWLRLATRD